MASEIPRKPESAHKKKPVSVSVRTIGRGPDDEEADNEDKERRDESQPLNTKDGSLTRAIELRPNPSIDPNDPLVCAHLWSLDLVLTCTELAKMEERTCVLIDTSVVCNSICTQDNIRANEWYYCHATQCLIRGSHSTHRHTIHFRGLFWAGKLDIERHDRKTNAIRPFG